MTASNGRECLDKVSKHKIDLILLDMMMPGISGETVLQKIRKDKKYNKTKIIILTAAKFTEPERKKLMREGAQGFLGKPISIEALEKEMEKLLHKKCAKT